MTKTRNISDLLDANGDVKSGALDNVPPSNDASALTTGTLPSARLGTVTSFTSTGIDDNATSTAMTIDSSGSIGIGTTAPFNATANSFTISNTSPTIFLEDTDSSSYGVGRLTYSNGILNYLVGSRNGTNTSSSEERFRLDASGNVTFSAGDGAFIAVKDSNTSNKISFITNQGGILKFGRVDDDLSSNKVQAMQVDNEGNVSIGTTSSLHNLHVQANGQTTDSWIRHGDTLSCSGSWNGGKQVQVDWDFSSSVSYVLEFLTASYGSRKHFVVGGYRADSQFQTIMTDNGGGTMTQGTPASGLRWTSSGGTHGVYCVRITSANGHHNALVTLI